jgi:hypothetical protein
MRSWQATLKTTLLVILRGQTFFVSLQALLLGEWAVAPDY